MVFQLFLVGLFGRVLSMDAVTYNSQQICESRNFAGLVSSKCYKFIMHYATRAAVDDVNQMQNYELKSELFWLQKEADVSRRGLTSSPDLLQL